MSTIALTPLRYEDEQMLRMAVGNEFFDFAVKTTYSFSRLMSYYSCAIMEIETKLKVLNEDFALRLDRQPISGIKTRLKDPVSISIRGARPVIQARPGRQPRIQWGIVSPSESKRWNPPPTEAGDISPWL